jgi:hypothetical protein
MKLIIGSDEFRPTLSLTAPFALRAPCAAKERETNNRSVNDVMALFGVNDVMALETYAPGFMLSPAPQVG